MSRANVEVVRAVFEAWNAGDMDAVRELLDPGVILRHPKDHPEPGPFVGREEVMREWEQLRETWDTDLFEFVSDFSDAADRVVGRWVWRTGGRGPEASFEITSIHTLRAGKVTDIQVFWDHAEALKAAGLRE